MTNAQEGELVKCSQGGPTWLAGRHGRLSSTRATQALSRFGLYTQLAAAAKAAGLQLPSAQDEDGAAWGARIGGSVSPASLVHFEAFLGATRGVLFPAKRFAGNGYTDSGLEREAQTKGSMRRAGWHVLDVGLLIGAGHRRANRRAYAAAPPTHRDAIDTCLCASPDAVVSLKADELSPGAAPPAAVISRAGDDLWMWEHKEVTLSKFDLLWAEVAKIEKAAAKGDALVRGASLTGDQVRRLLNVDRKFIDQCDHVVLCGAPAAKGCILHLRPRAWRLVNGILVEENESRCRRELMLFIDRSCEAIAKHEWQATAVISAYWALRAVSAEWAAHPARAKATARAAARGLRKGGCQAMLRIRRAGSGPWQVYDHNCMHNHAARHDCVDPVTLQDLLEMRAQVEEDNASIESVLLQRERHGLHYDRKRTIYYINSGEHQMKIKGGAPQTRPAPRPSSFRARMRRCRTPDACRNGAQAPTRRSSPRLCRPIATPLPSSGCGTKWRQTQGPKRAAQAESPSALQAGTF